MGRSIKLCNRQVVPSEMMRHFSSRSNKTKKCGDGPGQINLPFFGVLKAEEGGLLSSLLTAE